MDIAVFGANGPTGRRTVRHAIDAGHRVLAVTRHPASFPIHDESVDVREADALDAASVDAVVADAEAVISTLGVPFGRAPISIYSVATANIVSAMREHGRERLVCVSSSGTDPADRGKSTGGNVVFEKIFKPLVLNRMGRTLYEDMQRMESLLRESDLDYTIVRPSGLYSADRVSDYLVSAEHIRAQYTSREDLAHFLVRLATGHEFSRSSAAIATTESSPSFLQFVRTEAMKRESA